MEHGSDATKLFVRNDESVVYMAVGGECAALGHTPEEAVANLGIAAESLTPVTAGIVELLGGQTRVLANDLKLGVVALTAIEMRGGILCLRTEEIGQAAISGARAALEAWVSGGRE